MTRILGGAALGLQSITLLLSSSALSAEPELARGEQVPASPRPPSEGTVDARAEYHKGNAAFREGRFTAARFHYQKSLDAEASFDALCNLGRAEASLGDDVAAYEHLRECKNIYPTDPELADGRQRFVDLLDDVAARLTAEQQAEVERRSEPAHAPEEPKAYAQSADAGPRYSAARVPVSVSLGVLGIAGASVGMGLFVMGLGEGDRATVLAESIDSAGGTCRGASADERCEELALTLQSSDDLHNAGVTALAVGGGLAVSALLTYLLWPRERAQGRQESALRGEVLFPNPGAPGSPLPASRFPAAPGISQLRPLVALDPGQGLTFVGLGGRFE